MNSPIIKKFAPAKVNLFLHVTGKRDDGYHTLESLIGFADFGDRITIQPSDQFSFTIADSDFPLRDKDNSIIKAVNLLSDKLGKPADLSITLEKNIPIGAGLGGGSSDAATTIHGLLKFWQETLPQDEIDEILLKIGADTSACYSLEPAYIKGIGEIIKPIHSLPQLPAILVYPNKFCSTADVFQSHEGVFSQEAEYPNDFADKKTLYEFLENQKNDLTDAAIQKIPDIQNILEVIKQQKGCSISRLTGSGSTCFGLFDTIEQSTKAAEQIQKEKPHWWVRPVIIS